MLKHVLRANAASCATFGAIFAFAGPSAAAYLGAPPVLLLQILGVGLMINAGLLIWTSLRAAPDRAPVLVFAMGDAVWVIATAILLAAGIWITTTGGIIWSVAVAVFVGTCGAAQLRLAPNR